MKAQEIFERVTAEMANGKSYEEAWQAANSGTSEGAKKGWEHKRTFAMAQSTFASKMSQHAFGAGGKSGDHMLAAQAHADASKLHNEAMMSAADAGEDKVAALHESARNNHAEMARHHLDERKFAMATEDGHNVK